MSTIMENAEELVAENAKLRDKLHRTEEQRVMDEIVQHSLNDFLNTAQAQLSLLQESENNEHDEEGEEGNAKARSFTTTATHEVHKSVAETLEQLTRDKLELEKELVNMQTHKVKALNTQVEQLTHDKEALLARVKELESRLTENKDAIGDSINTSEEEQIPSVKEEVKLLRESEQLLQRQLQALQSHQLESVSTLQTTVSEHVNALHTLPALTEQLATLQTSLQNANMAQHVTSFVADEDAKRNDALHEMLHTQLKDITTIYSNKLHVLENELAHHKNEKEKLQQEQTALVTQLANLQSEFDAYKAKYNVDSENEYSEQEEELEQNKEDENEEEMAGMAAPAKKTRKRRRFSQHSTKTDTECAKEQLMQMLQDANSKRSEFIKFWYEGKDTIAKLEEEIKTLKENTQTQEHNEIVIRDLEKSKSALSLELVNLTQEIDKLRKVNQDQRIQHAGLSAERDYLLAVFTSALVKSLPEITTNTPEQEEEKEKTLPGTNASTTSTSVTEHTEEANNAISSSNEENKSVINKASTDDNELLSPEALRSCCKTIRNAAAAQAAASAAIVIDESALQAAKRTAYELQNSVSQLEKRKNNLAKIIALRENRLKALLEREAVTILKQQQQILQKEDKTNNNNILMILEYVEQATNDILELLLIESTGDSDNNYTAMKNNNEIKENVETSKQSEPENANRAKADTHMALQRRLITSQEKLLQSQRRVQQLLIEKDDLVKQVNTLNEFKLQESQTQQTQIKLLQQGNNTLTSQVLSLQTQLSSWQGHYSNIVQLSKQILYALGVTLNLLQTEQTHHKECQELIKEERQAMVSLLQREAEMWSVASSNAQHEEDNSTHNTLSTCAQGVIESVQRLQTYMDETIKMLQLHNEQDKTRYMVRLAHALHEHVSVIQRIRNTFTQLTQEQSKMLANKLLTAQENWNSIWESKYKEMAREQEIMQTSQQAQSTLWERLEHHVTHINNGKKGDKENEMENEVDNSINEEQNEQGTNASAQETLSVIKRFLISARAQLQHEEEQHHLQEEEEEEEESSDEEEEELNEEEQEEKKEEKHEESEANEEEKEVEQTNESSYNKQSEENTNAEDVQLQENSASIQNENNENDAKTAENEVEKGNIQQRAEEHDENEERIEKQYDDSNKIEEENTQADTTEVHKVVVNDVDDHDESSKKNDSIE